MYGFTTASCAEENERRSRERKNLEGGKMILGPTLMIIGLIAISVGGGWVVVGWVVSVIGGIIFGNALNSRPSMSDGD